MSAGRRIARCSAGLWPAVPWASCPRQRDAPVRHWRTAETAVLLGQPKNGNKNLVSIGSEKISPTSWPSTRLREPTVFLTDLGYGGVSCSHVSIYALPPFGPGVNGFFFVLQSLAVFDRPALPVPFQVNSPMHPTHISLGSARPVRTGSNGARSWRTQGSQKYLERH